MDFSESYKLSSACKPSYSPDGRYLATAVEYRLIIREAESLRIVQLYSCLDRIDVLRWAPNSLYVLCGLLARGMVQVWSVDQPDWSCKIDEGPAGVAGAQWTPDGLGVLLTAQCGVRLTLWGLADRACTYLRGPKHTDGRGVAFSPDGTTLAVLERYDLKDWVTLYSRAQPGGGQGGAWQQRAHVALDTSDAADLAWAPNSRYLAVWDSCLEYRVVILSAAAVPLAVYSAYQGALGVKACSWNPSGEVLAVGSYDQAARLLEHVTWQPLMTCSHPARLAESPGQVVVYREVASSAPGGTPAGGATSPLTATALRSLTNLTPTRSPPPSAKQVGGGSSQYVVEELPVELPGLQPNMEDPQPTLGVGVVRWSPDSQYVATRNDSQPGAVWVWDMAAMELSALCCHTARVEDVQWAPHGSTLAMVACTGKVYLWTPAGASIVHIPLKNFCAHSLAWNPRGGSFCLMDRDTFCCAFAAGNN